MADLFFPLASMKEVYFLIPLMLTLDLGLALTDGVTQTLVRRELFGVRGWLSLVSCAPVMHHWELMPKSPPLLQPGLQ